MTPGDTYFGTRIHSNHKILSVSSGLLPRCKDCQQTGHDKREGFVSMSPKNNEARLRYLKCNIPGSVCESRRNVVNVSHCWSQEFLRNKLLTQKKRLTPHRMCRMQVYPVFPIKTILMMMMIVLDDDWMKRLTQRRKGTDDDDGWREVFVVEQSLVVCLLSWSRVKEEGKQQEEKQMAKQGRRCWRKQSRGCRGRMTVRREEAQACNSKRY